MVDVSPSCLRSDGTRPLRCRAPGTSESHAGVGGFPSAAVSSGATSAGTRRFPTSAPSATPPIAPSCRRRPRLSQRPGQARDQLGRAKDYSQFAPAMSAFEVIALRSLVRALQGMSSSNKKAGRALRDYSMRLLASHQFIKGNVRCLSAFYSGP